MDEMTTPPALQEASRATTVADLGARLAELGTRDAAGLARRLAGLRRISDPAKRAKATADLEAQVRGAESKLARRRAMVPTITFPAELPVSDRVDDLAAAIRDHQVVIVAGETGSGKSTQLPKICLSIGRGVRGLIGHTQPRRIAARALAERIAEETGTELGGAVGYTIRFGDHTGPDTLVKLMTDGILLAEITRDRLLSAYDTIIIDEAHERSLNIDFLLGYLVELLPRRPDLKLIITSATIDPQRFSRHFSDAPIVEVSGRTYPVEVRYRPYGVDDVGEDDEEEVAPVRAVTKRASRTDDGTRDLAQAIVDATDELAREGDGDILVFLSGEREITDTAEVLRSHLASRPGLTEVLPLYGRLSAPDQHKVFSAHRGRRIVLSTNVAETSLTVPGIRYVIDPGTARISRYSPRTKVQRLPIEPISQASAGQRAGRCGRVADGICIRLYSEDDFAGRPEYTDPEISRTSLASVILQMASLDLGDIASFPFLDPPDSRQITDGVTVLTELGALDRSGDDARVRLTPIGRSLAALPLDPRLARMIVEGDRRGCLADVLVIASALAIQDVREHPLDDRDRATASHARFADPKSDFLSLLNLWHYLADEAKARSGNAFRRMCRTEYLHYLRIREWQDLHAQLRQVARGLKMDTQSRALIGAAELKIDSGDDAPPEPTSASRQQVARSSTGRSSAAGGRRRGRRQVEHAPEKVEARMPGTAALAESHARGSKVVFVDTERVHTALLAGLLSHIGLRLEPGKEFQGTRGTKFVIWPGSALAKAPPRLVMAAELVETSRLWGRLAAAIDPTWVEQVGGDLLKRNYSEPRWDARRGQVTATERVTLLGVTLIGARSVQYDRIDPVMSREMFIRHALVEADWETKHAFFAANLASLEEVAEREDRARRRDIVIDDESLFALYDERIPAEVTSSRHFDSWWRKASRENPTLLVFTPDMLLAAGAKDVDAAAYPDTFSTGTLDLGLDYVFEPGRADDGVTVTIPLAVLARIDPAAFEAQIPGLRKDFAVALIRSLPKTLRRNFVPAPDFAAVALSRIPDDGVSALSTSLAATLTAMTGIVVGATDFDQEKIPSHLRTGFRVVDEKGRAVAAGKDLTALKSSLQADVRQAVARASGTIERTGMTEFPAAGIPKSVASTVAGHEVRGYPALVEEGPAEGAAGAAGTVGITVFTSEADQRRAMRAGTAALIARTAKSPIGHIRNGLTRAQMMTLTVTPHGSVASLLADASRAAIDALLDWAGGPAYTATAYAALVKKLTPQLDRAILDIVVAAEVALVAAHEAGLGIESVTGGALAAQVADMKRQLAALVYPGFLTGTTAAHLPDLTRYLQALTIRAGRVRENAARDRERMVEINALAADIDVAVAGLRPERTADADVMAVRRLLEEYRVASFAQPMRTTVPVSPKRILAAIAALRA